MCIAAAMFVVAALPIAKTTASWVLVTLATVIVLGFAFLFPWPTSNGGARRLLTGVQQSGTGNRSQAAGDKSNQLMSDGNINIHGNIDNGK
ncbi:hypothetical protein [Gordonia alkanivorans]|uniref:hypothetical protein n=1 Tax=Gordonia alkanivorans TaxID=84096 RepID=UPI0012F4D029|nr:hypothetical protein [Gordonia alkanivorans]